MAFPDPDFLVQGKERSAALSTLEYAINNDSGLCVLTGEPGCGKTTIVHSLLRSLGPEFRIGVVSNTHPSFTSMARWVLMSFDQRPATTSTAEIHQQLMMYLISEYGEGRRCVLIIDEAQNLTVEAIEELRVLLSINSADDVPLQIVLVGQPELLQTLDNPVLVEFAQCIAISLHLQPLEFEETGEYVKQRLRFAGASRSIFTEDSLAAIHYFSGGVPRLINSLCDLACVYAFGESRRSVDGELIRAVAEDRNASGLTPFRNLDRIETGIAESEIASLLADRSSEVPRPGAGPTSLTDHFSDFSGHNEIATVTPPKRPAQRASEPSAVVVELPYWNQAVSPGIIRLAGTQENRSQQWPKIPGRQSRHAMASTQQSLESERATRSQLRRRFLPRGQIDG